MKIGHCQTPTWDPYSWYMALKSPPINWHDWKHSDFNLLWRKNAEICNNTRFCYHLLVLNGCMVDRYIATNNCRNPHEYHKVYQFVDCLSLKHDWYMVYVTWNILHLDWREEICSVCTSWVEYFCSNSLVYEICLLEI